MSTKSRIYPYSFEGNCAPDIDISANSTTLLPFCTNTFGIQDSDKLIFAIANFTYKDAPIVYQQVFVTKSYTTAGSAPTQIIPDSGIVSIKITSEDSAKICQKAVYQFLRRTAEGDCYPLTPLGTINLIYGISQN